MTDLPAPLVGSEVDVSIFKLVELPLTLLSGDSFAGLSAEAFRAQLHLVFASWQQQPAASIPTATATLTMLAGFGRDQAGFEAVRGEILSRGWVECSDGRMYFQPLVEVVETAFDRRKDKGGKAAVRKMHERTRKGLLDVGVPLTSIDSDVVGRAVTMLRDRGAVGLRGARRENALMMVASDLALLPTFKADDGVADIRIAARKEGAAR